MSSGQISRAMAVLDALFGRVEGRTLTDIAEATGLTSTAAFRILTEFADMGYVRQDSYSRMYVLSYKLLGQAFQHAARSGVHDVAQPVLDRLATKAGELVRLAIVEDDQITYLAWAQGRKTGLRYEPVNGDVAPLFCTATGHAFLATMTDDQAAQMMARQGMAVQPGFGPRAPQNLMEALDRVREARTRGYGHVVDSFTPGMTALAAAVITQGSATPSAVVSIAIPTTFMQADRTGALANALCDTARELGYLMPASGYFRFARRPEEKRV